MVTGEIKTQDLEKDGKMKDDDRNQENDSDIEEYEDDVNEGNNRNDLV